MSIMTGPAQAPTAPAPVKDPDPTSNDRQRLLLLGVGGLAVVVVAAMAISVIGFSSMGWMLGSKAERLAAERADNAVVAVLTPICVEKFQQQTNSAAKLIEFKKIASWDQRALIAKDGWATTPGGEAANSAVASACAEKLGGAS